jgi:phosphoribosylamine--glycine ligase
MRILGIGTSCDLGAMYLSLRDAGHDVRVYSEDFADSGTMAGMLEHVADWRAELGWVRAAGREGVIVVETADLGREQDQLRRDGFQVIGGSEEGDRLENDRAYAQSVLHELGMQSPLTVHFSDFDHAIAHIELHPARYVFKLNGGVTSAWRNFVGQSEDGSDVVAMLRGQRARLHAIGVNDASFVLSEHVNGIEMGTGAFFNGERFLSPACLDWEHKRFFPGDIGELTGEMGTVVTYRGAERLFGATLAKLAPRLRQSGYVGYINLNTIVDERGIWPLELTSRFGYPGYAILSALQRDDWAGMFARLLDVDRFELDTAPGFAVGVVLTVPPFPYRYGYEQISKGLPITFHPQLTAAERELFYLAEVALHGGQLIASGTSGYLMVATGVGESVALAQQRAYALARRVRVPNLRYRNDIGDALLSRDWATLHRLGLVPAA